MLVFADLAVGRPSIVSVCFRSGAAGVILPHLYGPTDNEVSVMFHRKAFIRSFCEVVNLAVVVAILLITAVAQNPVPQIVEIGRAHV